MRSVITSKLDCCNALSVGIPDYLLKKLQLVQNNAAGLVTRSRPSHTSSVLKKLQLAPCQFQN